MSEAYNFTNSGEGSYDLEAKNLFYVVDSEAKVVPIYAEAEAHTASLTGTLGVSRAAAHVSRRATYNGCATSQQTSLVAGASAAQSYAASALS